MKIDWPAVTIEEIKSPAENALATGPFGSSISSRFFVDEGVPVIRGSNLSEDVGVRLIDEGLVFLISEKAARFRRSTVRHGDLVFTCWGTIGQVGLIDKRSRYETYVISNKQMKLTPDLERADPLFLYYALSGPDLQATVKNQAIGSSVPGFNLGQLRSVKLRLPPLPEQRAIADILGALDDKIELNRRTNETLEAISAATFKSWFVDFDPVRAKLEGRQPFGMNAATAALFPDAFQDSPLGKIPKGWRASTIGDELPTLLGGTPDRTNKSYWSNGTVPWINSGKVNEFRIIDPTEYITQEALEESAAKLLPTRTSVLAITGATLGQISLLEIEACMNQSVVAVLASETIPSEFIYFWLHEVIDRLVASQTGGAQQHVNKANVNELKLLVPPIPVLERYLGLVKPLFDVVAANLFSARTLAELRDTLLPKLLSGELRVKDAQRLVDTAT